MGRYPQSIEASIAKLRWHLENEELCTKCTIKSYISGCKIAFKILATRRVDILPHNVEKQDVIWFLRELDNRGLAVSTRKDYTSALQKICKYYNNNVFDNIELRWAQDTRPNVRWLNKEQVIKLLEVPKTPKQEMAIHLELCMGLRRVEVARLTVDGIHDGYMDVLGKGPLGGKMRSVPFHADTPKVLARFLEDRQKIINFVLLKNPNASIPKQLFLHAYKGELRPYSTLKMTAIDDLLNRVCKLVGFRFSNHDLRRTFGNILYCNRVPLATISFILGHDDIKTTLDYLGIKMKDMQTAMSNFSINNMDSDMIEQLL